MKHLGISGLSTLDTACTRGILGLDTLEYSLDWEYLGVRYSGILAGLGVFWGSILWNTRSTGSI